ncbi:MAG: hypothetical protein MZV65_47495 [Chromatiales bacterium]|nr:hypothetical protein [Chromatiales bacterium]
MLPRLVHSGDALWAEIHGGAIAHEGRQDEEQRDDEHRNDDGLARGLGVGHREEAHQNVRHARGAETGGHPERDLIPHVFQEQTGLKVSLAVIEAGLGRRVPEFGLNPCLNLSAVDDLLEELERIHANLEQHQEGKDYPTSYEKAGFNDLHPGCGYHTAEDDIDRNQNASTAMIDTE